MAIKFVDLGTDSKVVATLPDGTELTETSVLESSFKSGKTLVRITNETCGGLASEITAFFSKVFHDYAGTRIVPTQTNSGMRFTVELYFSNNTAEVPEGKIKNLNNIQAGEVNKKSSYSMMQALNRKKAGDIYELNDATKQLLADVCYGGLKANSPKPENVKRWKDWTSESREQLVTSNNFFVKSALSRGEIVNVKFTGCDLPRLISKIRGKLIISSYKVNDDKQVDIETAEAFYLPLFRGPSLDGDYNILLAQGDKDLITELFIRENPRTYFNSYQNSVRVY